MATAVSADPAVNALIDAASGTATNTKPSADPAVNALVLATNTKNSADVTKALYDANTMLYATTDNTPAALTVGASTFVGRKATGGVSAMSATEAKTVLAIAESDVANLTSDLGLKSPLAGPTFTGVPAAPTAAADTNTTQLATTAFVIGQGYVKLSTLKTAASTSATYADFQTAVAAL